MRRATDDEPLRGPQPVRERLAGAFEPAGR
jgi:hypothetical protein